MSVNLLEKKCEPCSGKTPRLKGRELDPLKAELDPAWKVVDEHHLQRSFSFDDFKQALRFVNRVGDVAEQEQHHPDICFTWGKAEIKLWTHAIDGLSENDLIVAAKVDRLHRG